jgi:hypothetical protein
MKSKKRSPIWPYLGILACLFVLSVTAPRAWDRMAHKQFASDGQINREPPAPASALADAGLKRARPAFEQAAEAESFAREPDTAELDCSREFEEARPRATAVETPTPAVQLSVLPPAPEIVHETPPAMEVSLRPNDIENEPDIAPPDEPAVAAVDDAQPAASGWPVPRLLIAQLRRLAENGNPWATQALELVQELCQAPERRDTATTDILRQLRASSEREAARDAGGSGSDSQLVRARYSLARWLDVWDHAAALEAMPVRTSLAEQQVQDLRGPLAAAEAIMSKGTSGAHWQRYLRLSKLRELLDAEKTDEERRAEARLVLDRLASSRLSRAQKKFIAEGPLAKLQTALRAWAAEDVPPAVLLAHLDQYERTGLTSDARAVANDIRSLTWSAPEEAEKLGGVLDTHYLNANLRVAVTSALANRLVPQPGTMEAQVQDVVVGVPVYGQSRTFTKLSVKFVPDARRIRLGLEANGLVDSDTTSESGPATFYNEGRSTFMVRKLLVLGPQGLAVWPAIAEAENSYSYLVSLETEFDSVPLMGALVRNIARTQHDDKLGEARVEVEYKVAKRAREQLDAGVKPHLVKAAKHIEDDQLATLRRLGIELVPVGLSTTEDRAVARVRLGGHEQLGAHTPRPRAPADSWFSMQLHASALNNVLEKLDLEGREFTLPELFRWIGVKLNRPKLNELDELPEGVHMKFAEHDAVRLRCEDGRVEVTLAFAEFSDASHRWRNFTVRTHYRPEAENLDPRFVRDTTIYLDGKSLKGKPQVLLRTIFSKVLSRNRDLRMLSEKVTSDPRMKGLQVTQFVVEDGWIGLAYSPRRAGGNVARRPK